MTKARRQLKEALAGVGAVIEVVDARVPRASRNPELGGLIAAKPRLLVLTRADLADERQTQRWLSHLGNEPNAHAVAVDLCSSAAARVLKTACRRMREEFLRRRPRAKATRAPLRLLVVGVPNVGKSTLINRLAGRKAARTGDRPAVTRGQQVVKVGDGIDLLDSPGLLWPKFEDQEVGLLLAASGAIREEVVDVTEVAAFAALRLWERRGEEIVRRFSLAAEHDLKCGANFQDVLIGIAMSRGLLGPGGTPDIARAASLFLRELQKGEFGRETFEVLQ